MDLSRSLLIVNENNVFFSRDIDNKMCQINHAFILLLFVHAFILTVDNSILLVKKLLSVPFTFTIKLEI